MTKEDVLKKFGEGLKQILEDNGTTELELAKALGTQSHVIYDYERGRKDPTTYRAAQIAFILNVTVDELMAGEPRVKRKTKEGREVLPVQEFNKDLIKRLNLVLKQAKMNNNQLAIKTGVDAATTLNVLAGKRQPRLSTVALMAAGMGANIEQLIPDLVSSED